MSSTGHNAKLLLTAVGIAATAASLASCSKLSPEAREITGRYYIPEISEEEPLLELNPDATITVRAIKPQVLTYQINGNWDVVDGNIVATLDPSSLTWEGDSSLIGNIPESYTRRIVGHTDLTLTIDRDGIAYVYHRRPE